MEGRQLLGGSAVGCYLPQAEGRFVGCPPSAPATQALDLVVHPPFPGDWTGPRYCCLLNNFESLK